MHGNAALIAPLTAPDAADMATAVQLISSPAIA